MKKSLSSRNNELIKEIALLKNNKGIFRDDYFLVEGEDLFLMAYKRQVVAKVFTLKELNLSDDNLEQYLVTQEILAKISNFKSPSTIVSLIKKEHNPLTKSDILYLDNIQDPGNFGTLLRLALAFKIENIIYTSKGVSPYNFKTIQASKGAFFYLNLYCDDNYQYLYNNKDKYQLIATSLDNNSIHLNNYHFTFKKDNIIILGNEGHGVSEEILHLSDTILKIKMNDEIESLNVGVAGGIILYNYYLDKYGR